LEREDRNYTIRESIYSYEGKRSQGEAGGGPAGCVSGVKELDLFWVGLSLVGGEPGKLRKCE
jgi:hypothetical protein